MVFKEGNNPFGKVVQPPDPVGHAIFVISPNDPATEELLQRVEQLDITAMLDDSEFGEHLKLARHLGMRVDADVETTFAVNKPNNPLSF